MTDDFAFKCAGATLPCSENNHRMGESCACNMPGAPGDGRVFVLGPETRVTCTGPKTRRNQDYGPPIEVPMEWWDTEGRRQSGCYLLMTEQGAMPDDPSDFPCPCEEGLPEGDPGLGWIPATDGWVWLTAIHRLELEVIQLVLMELGIAMLNRAVYIDDMDIRETVLGALELELIAMGATFPEKAPR